MGRSIRYGDYLQAIGAGRRGLSYNALMPPAGRDAQGRPIPPHRPAPIRLHPDEIARLLRPYVSVRFMDQVKAVVPLALYLALYQILILRRLVDDSWLVTAGLFAVIVGLMFFMEGLKLGLMPFGELIGHALPRRSTLPLMLLITLLLGIGVTFAEPAIGALQAAGQNVSPERAPYLWVLLNQWAGALVLVIGASVGLAARPDARHDPAHPGPAPADPDPGLRRVLMDAPACHGAMRREAEVRTLPPPMTAAAGRA